MLTYAEHYGGIGTSKYGLPLAKLTSAALKGVVIGSRRTAPLLM